MTPYGFWYPGYPYVQAVAVAPSMERLTGGRHYVDAIVTGAHTTETGIIGYIAFEGLTFQVRRESFGDCSYWYMFDQTVRIEL